MIDWKKPIEFTNGAPAQVLTVNSGMPGMPVIVLNPADGYVHRYTRDGIGGCAQDVRNVPEKIVVHIAAYRSATGEVITACKTVGIPWPKEPGVIARGTLTLSEGDGLESHKHLAKGEA